MAKGISLSIGLNAVNSVYYSKWPGTLHAAELDAESMVDLAQSQGFTTNQLLGSAATRTNVLSKISGIATKLVSGDLFLLTYSGHGGQVKDTNGDEPDAQDETWCLYDGQLVDDELYQALSKFSSGVRIFVLSDSCHSGTVTRVNPGDDGVEVMRTGAREVLSVQGIPREMPVDVMQRTYETNREFYEAIQTATAGASLTSVQASVLLISACQDSELAVESAFHGLFTHYLLNVWNSGAFVGTHRAFYDQICLKMMGLSQKPKYFPGGAGATFESMKPFQI